MCRQSDSNDIAAGTWRGLWTKIIDCRWVHAFLISSCFDLSNVGRLPTSFECKTKENDTGYFRSDPRDMPVCHCPIAGNFLSPTRFLNFSLNSYSSNEKPSLTHS